MLGSDDNVGGGGGSGALGAAGRGGRHAAAPLSGDPFSGSPLRAASAARVASLSSGGGRSSGSSSGVSSGSRASSPGSYSRAPGLSSDGAELSAGLPGAVTATVTSGLQRLLELGRGLVATTTAAAGASGAGTIAMLPSRSGSFRGGGGRGGGGDADELSLRGESALDTQPLTGGRR